MILSKNKKFLFAVIINIIIVFSSFKITNCFAVENMVIRKGEKMKYKISWMKFHAGNTEMKVDDAYINLNGNTYYRIVSETKSSRYVSFFYPVKDKIISLINTMNFYPRRYDKNLSEGNYRSHNIVEFDHKKGIASTKKKDYKIPEGVQDPFSAIYYFRNLPLEVGKIIKFDVFDGNKVFKLLIKVIKKEKIKVSAGVFETIKIEPIIDGAEGLFKHKGKLYVWVTDDNDKIPVLIKSAVLIGNVTVQLEEYN